MFQEGDFGEITGFWIYFGVFKKKDISIRQMPVLLSNIQIPTIS
jgi:hypothetical protein